MGIARYGALLQRYDASPTELLIFSFCLSCAVSVPDEDSRASGMVKSNVWICLSLSLSIHWLCTDPTTVELLGAKVRICGVKNLVGHRSGGQGLSCCKLESLMVELPLQLELESEILGSKTSMQAKHVG